MKILPFLLPLLLATPSLALRVPVSAALAALPAAVSPAAAAPQARGERAGRLVGTWTGRSAAVKGKNYVFREDGTANLDGTDARWSADSERLTIMAGGERMVAEYRIVVGSLTLEMGGERLRYKRVDDGKKVGQSKRELTPPSGNPLQKGGASGPASNPLAAADPLARTFSGEGVELRLAGAGKYTGELSFQGNSYPVSAERSPKGLKGTFDAGGQQYSFEATLEGDQLSFMTAGTTYLLQGQPLPSAGGAPPALQGVDSSPGKRWTHPRDWFSFEMPAAWSIAGEAEDALLINPGLGPNDTLDVVIIVTGGQLEQNERGVPIETLTQRYEGDVRSMMAAQGIQLQPATAAPRRVLVGDLPGCEQTWKGRTQDGKAVELWMGLVAKRDYYLVTMGILLDGKGPRYMPGIKRIFTTMEPTPPERNEQLQQAFAGHRISHNETTGSGSFTTIYSFSQGGGVHEENMFSGGEFSSATEDSGTYEVIGDELYLYMSDGQKVGQVQSSGGRIQSVRFGDSVYSFN